MKLVFKTYKFTRNEESYNNIHDFAKIKNISNSEEFKFTGEFYDDIIILDEGYVDLPEFDNNIMSFTCDDYFEWSELFDTVKFGLKEYNLSIVSNDSCHDAMILFGDYRGGRIKYNNFIDRML